jgi:hypothetical protein
MLSFLQILNFFVVPLATASALLAGGEIWFRNHPVSGYGVDEAILQGQINRANEGIRSRILLTGDSSGLVGVDATRLAATLGVPVQSLATMGNVGPDGWGRLVVRARDANSPPDSVVVLVHGDALQRTLAVNEFERAALDGAWPRLPFGENLRRGVLHTLGYFGDFPLPGAWGRQYGGAAGLGRSLESGSGTIADPTNGVSCPATNYQFRLSESIAGRLPGLASALRESGARYVRLGVMPIPHRCAGPSSAPSRDVLIDQLVTRLNIEPTDVVPMPMTLPDDLFAGFTHLNGAGRQALTPMLAEALARKGKPQ